MVHDCRVVETYSNGATKEDKPAVYVSLAQAGASPANLVVRVADDDPLAQAAAVQRVIGNVDP